MNVCLNFFILLLYFPIQLLIFPAICNGQTNKKIVLNVLEVDGNKEIDLHKENEFLQKLDSNNILVFYSEGYSYQALTHKLLRTGKMPKERRKNLLLEYRGTKKYYKQISALLNKPNINMFAMDYENNFREACGTIVDFWPTFSDSLFFSKTLEQLYDSYGNRYFNGYPHFLDTLQFKNFIIRVKDLIYTNELDFKYAYGESFNDFKIIVEELAQSIEYEELKKTDPNAAAIKRTEYMYSRIMKEINAEEKPNEIIIILDKQKNKNNENSLLIDLFSRNKDFVIKSE